MDDVILTWLCDDFVLQFLGALLWGCTVVALLGLIHHLWSRK